MDGFESVAQRGDAIATPDETVTAPHFAWMPFLGGVTAAAAAGWIVCRLPWLHPLPAIGLFLLAAIYVVATAGGCVVTTRILGSILPDRISRGGAVRLTRLELIAVLWFPLLILLLREASAWAIVISTFVAAIFTQVIFRIHTSNETAATDVVPDSPQLKFLQSPNSAPVSRGLFPLFCFAALVQIGLLALLMRRLFEALNLLSIASSLITWRSSLQLAVARNTEAKTPAAAPRIWPTFCLAIVFTIIVLAPYGSNYRLGTLFRGFLSRQLLLPALAPLEHRVQVELPKMSYSGVILLAAEKNPKRVVPPPPPNHSLTDGARAMVMKIPFDGVYWYFKAPDTRPETDAHVQHGSAAKLDVRSNDWRPILMEARQNLGSPVDLNCCSQIRVAIQNADNRPGTIALGVILSNTTLPGKPSVYLGQVPVASSHPLQFSIDRPPVNEVLNFKIPEKSKIRQFNEVTVVFQPAAERSMAGVKIAIQDFTLVPRGFE